MESKDQRKTKETLLAIRSAIKLQRLIVIFPSGRLARLSFSGLIEREWMPSAFAIAQKKFVYRAVHIKARNSFLYYLLFFLNTELKDLTLFREMLIPEEKVRGHDRKTLRVWLGSRRASTNSSTM